MAYAHSSGFATISTGDISVSTEVYTRQVLSGVIKTTDQDFTIPAGAFRVVIKNIGFGQNGAIATAALVDGETLEVGDSMTLQKEESKVDKIEYVIDTMNVITNGTTIWYKVFRP